MAYTYPLNIDTCRKNIPGNKRIFVIPVSDVVSSAFPTFLDLIIGGGQVSPPTLVAGKNWLFLTYGKGDLSTEEKLKRSDNGELWDISIKSYIQGDESSLVLFRAAMAKETKWIAYVEQSDNTFKMYGTHEQYLTISLVAVNAANKKMTMFDISGMTTLPAPFISSD